MKITKEFKLGIFVVVVIIATIFVINFLRGADLLGREITVCGHFDDVRSLVASAPVKIRGYAAGSVEKVEYSPETDDFIVECSIDRRFKIPVDSKMVIYSTSIMGGKGVRIDTGESGELVSDGAELQTLSDTDLVETLSSEIGPAMQGISALADSLSATVSRVNTVLNEENRAYLAASLAHLKSMLANADALTASVSGKSDDLKTMISNLNAVSEKLLPIMDSAQVTVANINSMTGQLEEVGLGNIVGSIDSAVVNVNDAVNKLKQPLGSLLENADSLVNAIKSDPKKYIKITVF